MPQVTRIGPGSSSRAWTALADVEGWPALLPTVTSVRAHDQAGGLAVGSRYEVAQPRLRTAEYVVTELDPGRRFVWQSRVGGITTTASHAVEDLGGGRCQVHLEIAWAGPLALVARLGYSRLAVSYMTQEANAVLRAAEGPADY